LPNLHVKEDQPYFEFEVNFLTKLN
jgi:hypothetical protein